VISMEVTFDHSSSIRTVTFSVQVCDTPWTGTLFFASSVPCAMM
jgi:hypothetical protein